MPYGRKDEGLHLPPVREALNGAFPDTREEALLSSKDADEPGEHRNLLLTGAREIVVLNSEHRLESCMAWNCGGQVQVKGCAAA